WIPEESVERDPVQEAAVRAFLSQWGPPVPSEVADAVGPDFDEQFEALLGAGPVIVSSIMGLFSPDQVKRLHARGISWSATTTTVAEAQAAVDAGADLIVAQGMEAGGHRGSFNADSAERQMVGLLSLLPAIVDAVEVPVVATGGIADAR